MVKTTRSEETHLNLKTDHNERKVDSLKEIVSNVTPTQPLCKKVVNIQTSFVI